MDIECGQRFKSSTKQLARLEKRFEGSCACCQCLCGLETKGHQSQIPRAKRCCTCEQRVTIIHTKVMAFLCCVGGNARRLEGCCQRESITSSQVTSRNYPRLPYMDKDCAYVTLLAATKLVEVIELSDESRKRPSSGAAI